MSNRECPDCSHGLEFDRRAFLKTASVAAVATAVPSLGLAADAKKDPPETYVKKLYDTLSETQRKDVCFAWDYVEKPGEGAPPKAKAKGAKGRSGGRGLLRTRVSNNWEITSKHIGSDYYTKDQQELIRTIFEGIYQPDWIPKIEKQLKDDAGGYGRSQSIAIFGKPGDEKFEFVMTGRHLTIRCDGNSSEHLAFGGPIFYGHAASGFNEKVGHPDNVFWHQALEANKVYQMLDGKQRKKALLARKPAEASVGFRGPDGMFPGIPVAEMTTDQKGLVEKTLASLLAPYRSADQEEVRACLKAQGGLDKCSLAFYSDVDLGDDGEWDNWRLEGPSFVWYFRGEPHVHVWVHVADSPKVELNAQG